MKIHVSRPLIYATMLGFVGGLLWLGAIRFFSYHSSNVHYHANFALYMNGQKDEFKNFTFYEEVQSCGSDQKNNPKTRVHMHDQKNYVVHVHEDGVTWGAFFANLGYTLGNNLIKTDGGVYIDSQDGKKLTFILNGQTISSVANKHIESEDVLLINYGNEDTPTLQKQFGDIPKDADEYNIKNDPSSCAGSHPLTIKDRFIHALGVGNN